MVAGLQFKLLNYYVLTQFCGVFVVFLRGVAVGPALTCCLTTHGAQLVGPLSTEVPEEDVHLVQEEQNRPKNVKFCGVLKCKEDRIDFRAVSNQGESPRCDYGWIRVADGQIGGEARSFLPWTKSGC